MKPDMSKPTAKKEWESSFKEISQLIQQARLNALKVVNKELILLYWEVGKLISKKIEAATWGDNTIDQLAEYISITHPTLTGFSRRSLYRMKQFYKTYQGSEFVPTLLTQISWSHHLHILSKSKSSEEREFYIQLAIKEAYSVRELERQIDSGYFERAFLAESKKPKTAIDTQGKFAESVFKDPYVLEFLNLPSVYSEKDLQKAIVQNLKQFILEFGRDFSFVGEEYRVQVGGNDYYIDLLFYHRGLKCLVAIELKIDDFKPEYLGKMDFYLEALDRDIRKPDENPTVGLILCKSKDDEVVEYSLSRNLSPTKVAEYETKLIDKTILKKKLHELAQLGKAKEDH